jgi:hypothetical protein
MLAPEGPQGQGETSYSYPNPGWASGVVGFGPSGPRAAFDPVRRVLTFTTRAAREGPRDRRADQARALRLVDGEGHGLRRSSSPSSTRSRRKTARRAQSRLAARHQGLAARLAPRARPEAQYRDGALSHAHQPQPLKPGEVYEFDISIEPNAYRFKQGNRIRSRS